MILFDRGSLGEVAKVFIYVEMTSVSVNFLPSPGFNVKFLIMEEVSVLLIKERCG